MLNFNQKSNKELHVSSCPLTFVLKHISFGRVACSCDVSGDNVSGTSRAFVIGYVRDGHRVPPLVNLYLLVICILLHVGQDGRIDVVLKV